MVVAARSWVVLTKDKRVRRRPAEVEALKASRAAVFVLTGGMMSGPAMAAALVAALPRMKRILATHTRPLLGLVAASGATTVAIGERRGGRRRSVDREGAEGDG